MRLGSDAGAAASRAGELPLRIASSVVLAALAIGSAWLGGWAFAALWLLAAVAVCVEWIAMARLRRAPALIAVATAGLAASVATIQAGAGPNWVVAIGVLSLVAIAAAAADRRDRAWSVAGLAYAGAVGLPTVALRADPHFGAKAVFWMFAVVWSTDVAAFFTGRAFGGPKLWRAVSPKKTWSGFAGGLAAATLAGTSVVALAVDRQAWAGLLPVVLAASAAASVASQGGDLFESALKRRFEVKDSGSLIPGHGGFMDRLDGFVAVSGLAGLVWAGATVLGRSSGT